MYDVLDQRMLNIPGSLKEIAQLAQEFGMGGIGLSDEMTRSREAAIEAKKIAEDYGLKWGLLFTPMDTFHEDVTDEMFAQELEQLRSMAELASLAGVEYSYNHVWSSSSLRPFEENFEWHVRRLTAIQKVMKDNGIRYGLEFLGPKEVRTRHKHLFIHTIAGALALADAAGGEAGFVFDTWHWFCGSSRKDDLYYALQHTDRMVCMHVEDGIAGKGPDEQLDLVRAMPMTTGVINAAEIYQLFDAHGYKGPVCCEPINPTVQTFAAQPARVSAAEVAEAYQRLHKR